MKRQGKSEYFAPEFETMEVQSIGVLCESLTGNGTLEGVTDDSTPFTW